MKLTRREFIQAAGIVAGAAAVHAAPAFAIQESTLPSPAINPAFLTGSIENWPLRELAAMGYKGLEITPACLRNISAWKSASDKAGLVPICVNALPDLVPYLTGNMHDGVERRRRETADHLLKTLRLMTEHGIGFLIVAPGRLAEGYQTPEQARELMISSTRELADNAEPVTILLQSVPRRMFSNDKELVQLIDDIGRPNVAAAMDMCRVLACKGEPRAIADKLGPRLRYVQLHGVDLRTGYPALDGHLPMGESGLKQEDILPVLKGMRVAVNITAPDDPLTAAREAIDWLD